MGLLVRGLRAVTILPTDLCVWRLGFFNQKVLGILQTVPGVKAIVEDGIANATATQ